MKDLLNLLEVSSENLPEIYLDMDGVIVNLMKGADAVVGGSFVKHDKEERWNLINQTKGFWENLDWMPSSKRLYKFIMRYDTFILSAYSGRDPSSKNGKMKWLGKTTNFKKSLISQLKEYRNKLMRQEMVNRIY